MVVVIVSDVSDVLQPDTTTDFTFLTQSFFYALRLLHLGVVQECIRYPHILRSLNRLSAGFEVENRNSLHHLSLKYAMDASLVYIDLMSDVFQPGLCRVLAESAAEGRGERGRDNHINLFLCIKATAGLLDCLPASY
jgi:hypothetical protein